MPRIFDNIEQPLLPTLQLTLGTSTRADICIGYFNLRGWGALADHVDHFAGGDGSCARVLIGMHRSASDELRSALQADRRDGLRMDNGQALRLKKQLAAELREQLTLGAPTDAQEAALNALAAQIRSGKVRVKLFLRHALHAKLYLCHTGQLNMPAVGFVGSSNLTFSGLQGNGELNVDVLDHDACEKLSRWFDDRWDDRWCLDISDELVEIIETSWVRPVEPYHIYLKIAYHLAEDARKGLTQFALPKDLRGILFDYQEAAVKLAARHVHERGGVVIGDVVGLGKTLMATALARLLEEDLGYEPLILAPKNLVSMWEDYAHRYGLRRCKVLSVTQAQSVLPELRRYRLVVLDESHNLRNREGKRYKAIRDYIQRNDSRCVLLTATPYNKTFQDLSSQLRLFLADDADLGIRPEAYLRSLEAQGTEGEVEFGRRHNAPVRSVAAFEASDQADDWRELMRLFMVRRTRSFVKANYALADCPACAGSLAASDAACPTCGAPPDPAARRFLRFPDGTRSYFPDRIPKTVTFETTDPADPYGRLYDDAVVSVIEALKLPRYGLAEYLNPSPKEAPTPAEQAMLDGLGRSGRRLVGFARTGLFKRLESSAEAFLLSVERHALRNAVVAHAIEHGLEVPLGTQDATLLDPDLGETDDDGPLFEDAQERDTPLARFSEEALREAAARVYERMRTTASGRFTWIRAGLFRPLLKKHLLDDARALLATLGRIGPWDPAVDAKLAALVRLVRDRHPSEKVLVFSQFADTVRALGRALSAAGVEHVGLVTGASDNPTALAHRFSPRSNGKAASGELRVLLATDVLSEGQNLQDAHVVVNFDLPWALIRLVQRAGRVDRIGQAAEQILCYTFFPAEGVEKIIRLRERVATRMAENAEVVGSDERFFEDVAPSETLADLYHEKAGLLDGDDRDGEVDIASQAHAIWQGAVRQDPRVKALVEALPDVVHATRHHALTDAGPEGVLVYTRRTARARSGEAHHTDALAWLDRATGRPVTESPLAILKAAECEPGTPGRERLPEHHDLVAKAVGLVDRDGRALGGQLGRRTGARFRAYERLSAFLHEQPLFATDAAKRAVQALYTHPLTETATDTLNRQLRAGLDDTALAELVVALHDDDRLVVTYADGDAGASPQILCSMGLAR